LLDYLTCPWPPFEAMARGRSASECPTEKFRHQLMLEVDHKRMSAATGSGLERPLVPVLDLAAERDEQRQRDSGPSRR
jgi:hypothetical protein